MCGDLRCARLAKGCGSGIVKDVEKWKEWKPPTYEDD